jgi:hypothetical protein
MARRAVLGHRFVAVSSTLGEGDPRPIEFESFRFIDRPSLIKPAASSANAYLAVSTNGYFVPFFGFDVWFLGV